MLMFNLVLLELTEGNLHQNLLLDVRWWLVDRGTVFRRNLKSFITE